MESPAQPGSPSVVVPGAPPTRPARYPSLVEELPLRGCSSHDEVIAAAVLHDVVEDAGVDPAELRQRFGSEVAALVGAVTEPAAHGS